MEVKANNGAGHASNTNMRASRMVASERNLDHMQYDEDLYDYMKSLIPFNMVTSNNSINNFLLGPNGLEKDKFLNIFYNDTVGKRELCYELILSAILPKEWSLEDDLATDQQRPDATNNQESQSAAATGATGQHEDTKAIPEGQELQCVLIDVMGQFSARKFMEKVRHVYDKHRLHEVLGPQATAQQITENRYNFVRLVLQNLFVFPCMDAIEFNSVARSLGSFLRGHKSVGLLLIDGLHFIENQDILQQREKQHVKQIVSGSRNATNTSVEALAAGPDLTGDDFFDNQAMDQNKRASDAAQQAQAQGQQQRFFVEKKTRQARSNRNDPKVFEQSLVDLALRVIQEQQELYSFAMIKTQARPFLRRAADLQEDVMNRGIQPDAVPQTYQPQMSADDPMGSSQLPGYGQILVESQIQTDDDQLRDRIRSLQTTDVLILRGDRDNSLVPDKSKDLNETLLKHHLSCMIVPHTEFQNRSLVQSSYLSRYLALYALFKTDQNLYTINDDVVKAFYI